MIGQNADWKVDHGDLLSQGLSINSKNLHDLYDFVAVMNMSLNILRQIAAKIAHLRGIEL